MDPEFGSLKQRIKIETVIEWLGIKMSQKDDKWRGPCPGCQSTSPTALTVTPSRQQYKCWVNRDKEAKPYGDIIDFVSHVKRLKKRDAGLWLIEQEGKGNEARTDVQKETPQTVPVLDHLDPNDKRLPVSPETATHFEGGFAAKGPLSGRFAVALHNREGEYIGACGLAISPEQTPVVKCYSNFDPYSVVFNAHRIGPGELYLVRSPLEVIRSWEAGEENVVSFLTDAITSNQLAQLAVIMTNKGCTICYPHL